MKRGEVWMASLDPVRGSEHAGTLPVIVLPADFLNSFLPTAVVIPARRISAGRSSRTAFGWRPGRAASRMNPQS